MTEKQKKFVCEYLDCKDEVQAYFSVYSNCTNNETAFACAKKILDREDVKKYIENLGNGRVDSEVEISDANYGSEIATAKEIMRDLTDIARGDKVCDKDQFRALEVLNRTIVSNKNDEAVTVVFEGMDKLED